MIKLPVSAHFLALVLTAATFHIAAQITTHVFIGTEAFASSNESSGKADRSLFCEKALSQISANISNRSSNKPDGAGTVEDVILDTRSLNKNFFVINYKNTIIKRAARNRVDALLTLHRALFAPALVYVDVGGEESPDVVARLERIDLNDYPMTTADHVYIIDPHQPNVAEVVGVSTRADNAFTIQLLLEQKIRTLPLLAELDSLILLAARKLKLEMTLKKTDNGKYDLRTFVVHGHRSTEALPKDFKLTANDVVSMHRIRNERTGEENLRVIIKDPIEPFTAIGQARYAVLESSDANNALLFLEAILDRKTIQLKTESSVDSEGALANKFLMSFGNSGI